MDRFPHTPPVDPIGVDALPGQRHALTLPDGSAVALVHLPAPAPQGLVTSQATPTPLLVVHSVNATASAFEMLPTVLRQANRRPVVAIDLPGFGMSDKPDQRYTPQQMQQAVVAAIQWTQRHVAPVPIDVMALSLGCEFAAEAVLQQPHAVRTLALISPTGMESGQANERYQRGVTRERPWLRRLLRGSPVGTLAYRLLTSRAAMRWFLARSWGRPDFDKRLLAHGRRCAALPGAQHAPLDFVAGALFTTGIIERYRALPVPLWVAHGTRGSFTDFDACPARSGAGSADSSHPVERTVFESGAMPHFELPDQFDVAYQRFLHGQRLVEALARRPANSPAPFRPLGAGMRFER